MNARLCPDEVNIASDTAGELWHKRLCHMSAKGMKRLADDNLIPELVYTDVCQVDTKSHAGA